MGVTSAGITLLANKGAGNCPNGHGEGGDSETNIRPSYAGCNGGYGTPSSVFTVAPSLPILLVLADCAAILLQYRWRNTTKEPTPHNGIYFRTQPPPPDIYQNAGASSFKSDRHVNRSSRRSQSFHQFYCLQLKRCESWHVSKLCFYLPSNHPTCGGIFHPLPCVCLVALPSLVLFITLYFTARKCVLH